MPDVLILGLGNELLADDAVGILAVRRLQEEISVPVDFVECSLVGMALLDKLAGYERAILIDVIQTGQHPVGTILEMDAEDFAVVQAPSPHYSGLPEVIAVAAELDLPFPSVFKVLAIEVSDVLTLGGNMSREVGDAVDDLVVRVSSTLSQWQVEKESCHA